LGEARQGVKDFQYRNRQEKARGDVEVLRDIAKTARDAGLPEHEATELVRDGVRRIAEDFLPGSPRQRRTTKRWGSLRPWRQSRTTATNAPELPPSSEQRALPPGGSPSSQEVP
jgi:hypothetical protein